MVMSINYLRGLFCNRVKRDMLSMSVNRFGTYGDNKGEYMVIPKTITKIFIGTEGSIPARIDVPVMIPIEGRKQVVNCHTTGRTVSYWIREIEYGLENLMFLHYSCSDNTLVGIDLLCISEITKGAYDNEATTFNR